jgi:hypothetical protein
MNICIIVEVNSADEKEWVPFEEGTIFYTDRDKAQVTMDEAIMEGHGVQLAIIEIPATLTLGKE